MDASTFSFKEFLDRVTEEYQNDQEFMELLKVTNTNIENLKEFIRVNLAKDPSIYVIKDIWFFSFFSNLWLKCLSNPWVLNLIVIHLF